MAHATVAELNAHLPATQQVDTDDDDAVAEAERLLERASELVDDAVRAPYHYDDQGDPTDADVAAALRLATVAQYEQWLEVDEANAIDGLAGTQIAVPGYSGPRAPTLAPRAFAALRAANLHLPHRLALSQPTWPEV